jgi:thioredoxin reductase (NADPH)
MHDLIIIGAGPAGLTAALYAGRSRLKTLLLEKMVVGGRILMSEHIENFPGFPKGISTNELIKRMEEHVRSLDVEILSEEVLELDAKLMTIKTDSKNYPARSFIIATGAKPRRLGVPGEDKFTGRGVSYCATCDAPFFKDKSVVIVGGGNAVAEEALYLTRFARSVTVIHRRHELRASAILQEKLKSNGKIHFLLNSVVAEITGSHKLESITVEDLTLSHKRTHPCDGVFIYIGYDPDTEFAKQKLHMDETGFLITDENMATSHGGIFACGDCRKKNLYQVITACGDGAIAADSAYKYIVNKGK